jgi:hypothetical protein
MAKRAAFNVFPFSAKMWCARRTDGLVCGYFVGQAGAVRFARRETCGMGAITIQSTLAEGFSLLQAA